ncbi:GDSL esterase/lipase [Vitis vinifera]|uniref:GDSL esterase/lipase n=1 Tax=Vitis vinifera TaxID=29760 RepID=A0A438EFT2_VITVI|nr:GDSL esterase/lipase [Vitis vinifera]
MLDYDIFGSGMISSYAARLPKPGEFSKALYTIDIGHNNLAYAFQNKDFSQEYVLQNKTEEQVRATIPNIVNQFTQALQQLYDEGARFFWVHNPGPIGCLPLSAIPFQAMNGSLDQYGCIKYQNDIAQEFNQQQKDGVTQLKTQLPLATFTYIDIYSAKFSLISDAKNQGFDDPLNYCCGSLFPYPVFCGSTMEVNETVYGNPCDDPWARISWDGIHYTEAANRWVATKIISLSLSGPPVPITNACS